MRKARVGLIAAGVAVLVMAGCTGLTRSHGWVPSEADLQEIIPGVDTRGTVEDVLGVPSTVGVLGDSGLYYVQSTMEAVAWRAPEVVDRQIVAIRLDSDEVVTNIERFGLEDGQVVRLSRRVTESAASDIGFIRRLFGNIGGIDLGNTLGN